MLYVDLFILGSQMELCNSPAPLPIGFASPISTKWKVMPEKKQFNRI